MGREGGIGGLGKGNIYDDEVFELDKTMHSERWVGVGYDNIKVKIRIKRFTFYSFSVFFPPFFFSFISFCFFCYSLPHFPFLFVFF
jgi:CRISPR/Cas system CMR-associated protein Cmr3 (group 5 of RAMP superfamily)